MDATLSLAAAGATSIEAASRAAMQRFGLIISSSRRETSGSDAVVL
jgi:hypothetical protein